MPDAPKLFERMKCSGINGTFVLRRAQTYRQYVDGGLVRGDLPVEVKKRIAGALREIACEADYLASELESS